MKDRNTSNEQLFNEFESLRRRVRELEGSEASFKETEQLLRESEERFRLLYENAPLGYQSLDEKGHFLEVNQAWLDMLGYSRNEVIGKWCGDFLTAPYQEKFKSYFPQFKAVGEIRGIEFEMVKKDGSQVIVAADGRIGHDAQGRFRQTHCILRDITEQKRGEEELREMEGKLRTLVDNIPDCIARFDRNLSHVYVNPATCRTFGISPENFVGNTIAELSSPGEHAQVKVLESMIEQAFEEGTVNKVEAQLRTSDGVRFFDILHVPEKDKDGKAATVLGIARDVTERKKAEERLRLLRFALDHVREAAFLTDEIGRFRFVNEEACSVLGYARSELLDLGVSDIDPDYPLDRWLTHWNDLKTQGSLIFEARHKTKDGRIFPVEINANYFEYEGRSYNLALVREITERKQAEQERLENLWFFESMDRINRAIQGTSDIEQMMSNVLDIVLSIFDCDRAFLMYPCDPQATSWTSPMERTKPEYPGVLALGRDMPMDREVAETLRILLDSDGPVKFGPSSEHALPAEVSEAFGFKSFMSMALHPKVDKPWQFGIHACSYPRVWTYDEERLFQEIGRRLGDALNGLLMYRNLRENEAKLAEAQRIAHIGYWDRDLDADSIALSAEARRIFGLSQEESFAGLSQWHERWLRLIHPEDRSRISKAADELLREGSDYDVEYRVVRPDGELRIVHAQGEVTRDESGQPHRAFGTMQDITERKQAEEAVSRANKDWEQTFDSISDMVMVLDVNRRILRANKATAAALGRSEQELKGEFCFELVHDKDEPPAFCPYTVLLEDGKEHSTEVFEPQLGRSLDVRVSPLSDETGTIIGAVHVARDITEQKSLQSQLLLAQKMESVGTLAGGIAHDFNNLLQIVLGYSDMLLFNRKPSDPSYEGLHAILQAARDGSELTNRILAFSRKLEPNSRPLSLNNEIKRVEKMLRRTVPRMIRIELRLTKDLMTVNADPGQMEQILLNLAVNAQHAMPDGGVLTIETANVSLDEDYSRTHLDVNPGNYALLTVSDTGHGMDKEVMEHIFEPFYTTKEPGLGTGLGLAMVFGIVKSHKGHMTCWSEPGTGTTFRIYLPAIVQEIGQDATVTQQMPARGTETILLVDDEKSVREIGEQMLTMAGYRVVTATNGREALEVYRLNQDRIALVLLDLIMPEMGGKQCLEELLKIEPRAKVIIASGFSAKGPTKETIETGARGLVRKPYDMRQMLQAVREVLDSE